MSQIKLSLVITLLNEEDNIEPLLKSIYQNLEGINYEVILVDDGSTDATVRRIQQFASERVQALVLQRNYGQSTAMAAGIHQAQGEYIVTLDGDLQNDPSDIPMLLQMAEDEGWELIAGYRKNRQDGALLRKIPSKIANALIRKLTGVYLQDYGCTLKLFRKEIAKNLGLYGELHRFIPVLAKMQGAYMREVAVKHHPRIHGKSKYGLGRTFKVMSDLLLILFFQKYFSRPMHLFGPPGILSFFSGIGLGLYLLFVKLMGNDIGGRPLLTLTVVLLLGGLQLITFGFMAEIQMRTYYESQHKPNYTIKRIYNIQQTDGASKERRNASESMAQVTA
ncbi:glycosyltransferase family 2 protein [Xanthocytophaga agilis]|uniref:Glycosyltransferase family 2 protein n=1 Tax=Xanthocytophaga agilis TaxID=3048010 RepID=A0AAE3R7X8_9BACT|nr:glycosyltransferase family 2 protein [Xanthocytophaga agilis]MDJ1503079.1 glycosyltransferase family 2 protein [Xanthocytophaga agilis]